MTDRKTTEIPEKKTRAVPKPRPKVVPRMEPMVGKYYSPVDLLRSASFSFDPKKLLFAALMLIPLMIVAWLARHFGLEQGESSAAGPVLFSVDGTLRLRVNVDEEIEDGVAECSPTSDSRQVSCEVR